MMPLLAKLNRRFGVRCLLLVLVALSAQCAAQEVASPPSEKWITVHVEDQEGRPIRNFEYTRVGGALTQLLPRADGRLPAFESVRDSQGTVRVRFFPQQGNRYGQATVIVGAPGYVTNFHVIEPENLIDTNVILQRGAKVSGKVVNSTGKPVAGAWVWLGELPHAGHHGMPGHIMESDASGAITSDRIPIGLISFAILHPDYVGAVYEHEVTSDRVNRLSFTLNSGAFLTGTLSFGTERPGEASISVTPVDRRSDSDGKRAECKQGAFALKGILPGTNQVMFKVVQPQTEFGDAGWLLREEIGFADGERKRIERVIPTGNSALSGTILVDGNPPSGQWGASIYLVQENMEQGRYLQVGTYTNDKGDYVFGSLPAGSWQVSVQVWDEEKQKQHNFRKQISLADGEALRLAIRFPEDSTTE
jgi:hypothetical protein